MSLLPKPLSPPPVVWTIAGSDNCAGGGIQADLKTLTALGVHGCTVITALTAQNSAAVSTVESASTAMLNAQINALKNDMPPRAIKIGMLGDEGGVRALAKHLADLKIYTICDPVMIASAGAPLISAEIVPLMKSVLFPHIDVLTPNLAEAEALTGRALNTDSDIEQAAADILSLGVKAVIIKGWAKEGFAQDFCRDVAQSFWLTSPRDEAADPRGTGCTFASALAAAHAHGFSFADAAVIAKTYVSQARRSSYAVGKGMPILAHQT